MNEKTKKVPEEKIVKVISTPNVDVANPNCKECSGNGYRWDNMICYCVKDIENEVVIVSQSV